MCMKTKNFTTTLSLDVINLLSQISKREHISRRQIIEEAISNWQKEKIKKAIKKSYLSSKNDPEMLELSNMGLNEWEDNVKKWEAN